MAFALSQIEDLFSEANTALLSDYQFRQDILKDLKWWIDFYDQDWAGYYAQDTSSDSTIHERLSQIEKVLLTDPFDNDDLRKLRINIKMCVIELEEIKETIFGHTQHWFLDYMIAAGYLVGRDEGHCVGVGNMSMQAFFCHELDIFNDRIKRTKNTPMDYFKDSFEHYRTLRTQLLQEGKDAKAKETNNEMVDFLGFYDGVSLNQKPYAYKLSPFQDSSESRHITLPSSDDDMKPQLMLSFCGAYESQALVTYLDLLQQTLGAHSFSLGLSCAQHFINLNYDPKTKRWTVIDANALPAEDYINTKLLAKKMIDCFHFNKKTTPPPEGLVLLTELYVPTSCQNECAHHIQKLQNNDEWKGLHPMSTEKIDQQFPPDPRSQLTYFPRLHPIWVKEAMKVSNNSSLALSHNGTTLPGSLLSEEAINQIVSYYKQNTPVSIDTIKELINSKYGGQDQDHKLAILKSLFVNNTFPQQELMELILFTGSVRFNLIFDNRKHMMIFLLSEILTQDISFTKEFIESPWAVDFACILAEYGYLDALTKLQSQGMDLNQISSTRFVTPFICAIQAQQTETMLGLHQLGADINQTDSQGQSPLWYATYNGYYDYISKLHTLGGTTITSGESLLMLAIKENKENAYETLLTLGAQVNDQDFISLLSKNESLEKKLMLFLTLFQKQPLNKQLALLNHQDAEGNHALIKILKGPSVHLVFDFIRSLPIIEQLQILSQTNKRGESMLSLILNNPNKFKNVLPADYQWMLIKKEHMNDNESLLIKDFDNFPYQIKQNLTLNTAFLNVVLIYFPEKIKVLKTFIQSEPHDEQRKALEVFTDVCLSQNIITELTALLEDNFQLLPGKEKMLLLSHLLSSGTFCKLMETDSALYTAFDTLILQIKTLSDENQISFFANKLLDSVTSHQEFLTHYWVNIIQTLPNKMQQKIFDKTYIEPYILAVFNDIEKSHPIFPRVVLDWLKTYTTENSSRYREELMKSFRGQNSEYLKTLMDMLQTFSESQIKKIKPFLPQNFFETVSILQTLPENIQIALITQDNTFFEKCYILKNFRNFLEYIEDFPMEVQKIIFNQQDEYGDNMLIRTIKNTGNKLQPLKALLNAMVNLSENEKLSIFSQKTHSGENAWAVAERNNNPAVLELVNDFIKPKIDDHQQQEMKKELETLRSPSSTTSEPVNNYPPDIAANRFEKKG